MPVVPHASWGGGPWAQHSTVLYRGHIGQKCHSSLINLTAAPELEAQLLCDGKRIAVRNPPMERGLIKSRPCWCWPCQSAVTVALPITCENATLALSNAQAPGAFPALETLLRAAPAVCKVSPGAILTRNYVDLRYILF